MTLVPAFQQMGRERSCKLHSRRSERLFRRVTLSQRRIIKLAVDIKDSFCKKNCEHHSFSESGTVWPASGHSSSPVGNATEKGFEKKCGQMWSGSCSPLQHTQRNCVGANFKDVGQKAAHCCACVCWCSTASYKPWAYSRDFVSASKSCLFWRNMQCAWMHERRRESLVVHRCGRMKPSIKEVGEKWFCRSTSQWRFNKNPISPIRGITKALVL